MVFCRERAWYEDEDAVEALEGVCSITDMLAMGSGAVETGQFQGAGLESSETSGMCVAGCYKTMEKAS